ncbi:MAG: CHC2 zinc finger domain-containing protein, partial [Flavobacteriales bacterium]
MISPSAIQQVKDAMRVEEVVGEFVALKRKGPRYLGLCPFHNEKTPSFNVSPNLGIFKCFGCGKAGDAITFLQEHEHLSYVEA